MRPELLPASTCAQTPDASWRDFLRHDSGVQGWRHKKAPGSAMSPEARGTPWRTVGRDIPRQVASPQSLTPFLPAHTRYRSVAQASQPPLDTRVMPQKIPRRSRVGGVESSPTAKFPNLSKN